MHRIKPRLKEKIGILLFITIPVISYLYIYSGIEHAPFHPDEVHKISETYYYHLFSTGNYLSKDWQEDFYARTNPPVGKYIMGSGLALQGYRIQNKELQDKFETYWDNPLLLFQYIPHGLLQSGRTVSVIFGVFTCISLYGVGRMTGNITTGLIAAFLLLSHPLFMTYTRMAMTDSILLFFMTLIVPIFYLSVFRMDQQAGLRSSSKKPGKSILFFAYYTLLPGICIGLAAGTKLNGALSGFFFIIATLGYGILRSHLGNLHSNRKIIWIFLGCALASGIVSVILFYIINPYLYMHPVRKIIYILDVYKDWMSKQMINPGDAIFMWKQKFSSIIYYHFLHPKLPFIVWNKDFHIQPAFILFCLGCMALLKRLLFRLRSREMVLKEYTLLSWLIIYGVGIAIWIPINWPRYYLPLSGVICLMTAYGVSFLLHEIILPIIKLLKNKNGFISIRKKCLSSFKILAASSFLAGIVFYGVASFESLPPSTFYGYPTDVVERIYKDRLNGNHGTSNILFNLGDLMLLKKAYGNAAAYYLEGLKKIEGSAQMDRFDERLVAVKIRAAEACARFNMNNQSYQLLESYIKDLRRFCKILKSEDPKVLNEFNRLIEVGEKRLYQLKLSLNSLQS